jgi:recombination protein RecA
VPATKKKGKAKVVGMTVDALEKLVNTRWGAGTMKRASDPSLQITRLPCGILSVDAMIGGGFARGRHAEIYGSANVGKNYLVYCLIATTQQNGGICCFIDVERTFDPVFAEICGVDLNALVYHRQLHGPRVIDFAETLLRSDLFDVVVIDSIATLLPMAEFENDMEAGSYGMEQAKLMSKGLRKLTSALDKTVLVFLNQTRENPNVTFGTKTTTSGGRAMAFYAGLRLELVKTETLKRKGTKIDPNTGEIKAADVPYGHRVLVKGVKDKTGGLAVPLDETSFAFNYEKGRHDHIEDLIYLGRKYGLISMTKSERSSKWWVDGYEDETCSGRPRFKKWLRKNRAVREELEEMILTAVQGEDSEEDEEDDDDGE